MVRISRINHYDSDQLYMPKTTKEIESTKKFSLDFKLQEEIKIRKVKDLTLLSEICWEIK